MRSVPHLIDNNSRMGEYAMIFMIPLFLLRTIDPLFGLLAGMAACAIYVRQTAGKPEGYFAHRIYRAGIPLSGLLPPRVRALVP